MIFDLADVYAEKTMANVNALAYFVLHPLARACALTNQHNSHGCAVKLVINPRFYCCVPLFFSFLKFGGINISSSFYSLHNPAIPNNHGPEKIMVVLKTKENPAHGRVLT